MKYLGLLGQVLCVISAIGVAIAFILIKKGLLRAKKFGYRSICVCVWWLGVISLKIFTSLYVIALGIADQATLSAYCAMILVFNSVFAWKFLGDHLNL